MQMDKKKSPYSSKGKKEAKQYSMNPSKKTKPAKKMTSKRGY